MKALLYKDLCVLWKQMKFMIFMVAIFCLMPDTGFSLNTFFVAYAGLIIPVTLFAYDERAKWDSLAAMMPYSTRDLVLSRYIFGWMSTVFAVLCYLAGQLLFSSGHKPAGESALILVMTLAMTLVVQAVYFPILFRLGAEKGRLVMLVVIVGIMVVVSLAVNVLRDAPQAAPGFLAPLVLIVAVLLCLASVKVAETQYAQRVW